MSLPAEKKIGIVPLADASGGLNINDPATSLNENQVAGSLNLILLKKGFKRWPGCENLTTKDACNDYFRGLFSHAIIAGTEYLYTVFGGNVYSINKTTGAIGSSIYNLTGTGEAWGGSHWGKFFLTNGTKVIKIEGASAYQLGITAPAAGSAVAAAGAGLPDGVYQIYIGYARKVSSVNVLYSQGYSLGSVTLGTGNNQIAISSFANSTDAQVNNKVVWMTDAGGTTFYYYYETGNNTTTTFIIADATAKNNAIIYDTFAMNNGLPGAFEYLHVFDNRIWGSIGNKLYYSQKATVSYDLEKFPAINVIEYPYQITGIFSGGQNLFLNTSQNGVMIQPAGNVGARFEHIEQRYSFKHMRTVADWNGKKIGLTNDGIMVFNVETGKFEEWDYGYNIRPALKKIWDSTSANFKPCGYTYRRENRIEYALSFCDTALGTKNNNRTYVLNLSRTFFQDNEHYITPWETVDRGFNYCCVDGSNTAFYGQSYLDSSTIYKELATHTTQKGIYDADGDYLTAATNMTATFLSRTTTVNQFTKSKIEDIALMLQISSPATVVIAIADDPSKIITQETDLTASGLSNWDSMTWDASLWSVESQQRTLIKGKQGIFGYSWYCIYSQIADDINMLVTELDVQITKETGRGI